MSFRSRKAKEEALILNWENQKDKKEERNPTSLKATLGAKGGENNMGVLRRTRRRRIVRAGLLGGAAYHVGKSAGRQQGEESADQQVTEDTGESKLEQLEKLGKLHDNGVLSDDEFAAEKEKVLG